MKWTGELHLPGGETAPQRFGFIDRTGQIVSLLRRAGPQHARDLGLRAEVDGTTSGNHPGLPFVDGLAAAAALAAKGAGPSAAAW